MTHPGETLYYQHMSPQNMRYYDVAVATGISIEDIIGVTSGGMAFTKEIDAKLQAYFGTKKGYWVDLQNKYNLKLKEVNK